MFWWTPAGKIVKIFVWDITFCEICLAGAITWKTFTQWHPNFLETVKKFANFLEMSATPETLSITIRQFMFLFSPNKEFTSFSSGISWVLNLNVSINESSSSGSFAICTSASLLKQDWILAFLLFINACSTDSFSFHKVSKKIIYSEFFKKSGLSTVCSTNC